MQILPSTFIALAAIVLLALWGPRRGLWVFMALTPMAAAAAFNLPAVGGASIGLAQLAVLAVVALICVRPEGPNQLLGTLRPGQPGFWLALLLIYSAFSAIYAPALFAGQTDVFSISRSANARGIVSTPLRPSTGNITQLFRMTLSFLGFFAFATAFRRHPDTSAVMKAMVAATLVHVTLGWLDVLGARLGMAFLLEPIRTANYAILSDHYLMGFKRMIGGFPEASAFGAYSMGLFAFWLHYWIARPQARLGRWMLALSALVLIRSTSSGAYVSLAVFALGYGGWHLVAHLRRSLSRQAVLIGAAAVIAAWLAVLGLAAAYQLSDPVTFFFDRLIFDKLDTRSGIERMSWNAQAWRNFLDTGTIGAGLGSVRASNWLLASLGSLGLIGTGLFSAMLASVFRMPVGAAPDSDIAVLVASLKVACAALFLTDLLTAATPNLGVTFFTLAGVATGLARGSLVASARPGIRLAQA